MGQIVSKALARAGHKGRASGASCGLTLPLFTGGGSSSSSSSST